MDCCIVTLKQITYEKEKKAQQKLHLSNQEKKKIKTACNYAYKLAN